MHVNQEGQNRSFGLLLHQFIYVMNFKINFTLIKFYVISCKDFNCVLFVVTINNALLNLDLKCL